MKKNIVSIAKSINVLLLITPQATKQLARTVPNILLILYKLLNLPLCLVSTYLLDNASEDGFDKPFKPKTITNITILAIKFLLIKIK